MVGSHNEQGSRGRKRSQQLGECPMKDVCRHCAPLLIVVGLVLVGCESDGSGQGTAFPEFLDANENAINDHVEGDTHFVSPDDPRWHGFVDSNRNAACDLAEQSDPVWHGPGYIDGDMDGVCDYWDSDSGRHQQGRRDIVHGSDFGEIGPRNGPHH